MRADQLTIVGGGGISAGVFEYALDTPGVLDFGTGGQITGLTGSGLVLTLIDNSGTDNSQTSQVLAVGYDATGFNFVQPLPYSSTAAQSGFPDFFGATVSTQPVGQTCLMTNAIGAITSPGLVTSVKLTCVPNTTLGVQGVYRLSAGGSAVTKWLAFAPDGTYIFADIQYPPDPAAGCYGVDYGAYDLTSTTINFANAVVYLPLANPPANCGFTDGQGNVGGTPAPFSTSGSGQNRTITLSNPSTTFTGAAVPSVAGSLVGAWTFGPGLDQGLLVFGSDGHYLVMSTQADLTTFTSAATGVEYGCYTVSGASGAGGTVNFDTSSSCAGAVTTPGVGFNWTFGIVSGSFNYATPDANTFVDIIGGYSFAYTRLVPN